mgnify:CR=1 FL=1
MGTVLSNSHIMVLVVFSCLLSGQLLWQTVAGKMSCTFMAFINELFQWDYGHIKLLSFARWVLGADGKYDVKPTMFLIDNLYLMPQAVYI